MWNHQEKLDAVHIPYKDSGQLLRTPGKGSQPNARLKDTTPAEFPQAAIPHGSSVAQDYWHRTSFWWDVGVSSAALFAALSAKAVWK